MSCLTPDRIYAYLDGELPEPQRLAFDAHLAGCASCRAAVAERRLFVEAAETLAPIEIPDDFAASIVARLPLVPARKPIFRRPTRLARPVAWAAASAGLALLGAGGMLLTGLSLPELVLKASRFLWGNIQGLASFLAKAAAYAAVAAKVLGKILSQLLEGFRVLTSFIGPEVQLAYLAAALVLAGAGFALWRRRPVLEKTHEE
jgi:predicted anti-sigma-YlaC factor YlaD